MKKIILSSIALLAVAGLAAGLTYAYFTDTKTSVGNNFSSGTLLLNGPGIQNFDVGSLPKMAPGDKTGTSTIVIKNDGTLDLAWFGNLVVTGNDKLREAIYIDYASMEFMDPNGTTIWEPVDTFIVNGVGAGQWPTTWSGMNNLATLKAFDGNANMAPGTPYEFMGALKPGYFYRLSLRFGFAPNAGNEYQGLGASDPVSVSFQVNATQVNAGALESLHSTLGNHLNWLNLQLAKQD